MLLTVGFQHWMQRWGDTCVLEKFLSWTENTKGAWEWQMLATPPSSFGVCIVTTLRLSSASLLEVTSPYPCKDLNFSQTCSFFLKTRQPQPVRWVCLGELMGRSKLPQIRKITFSFSKQQHTSVQKKEGKKTFLMFYFTTQLTWIAAGPVCCLEVLEYQCDKDFDKS